MAIAETSAMDSKIMTIELGGHAGHGAHAEASVADFWRGWLRHRGYLYSRCVRWLGGNCHDAEDVLSEGALNAIVYVRNNPEQVLHLRPWLLRLLHNLCIDHLRAGSRIAPAPPAWAPPSTIAPGGWTQCPARSLERAEIAGSIEGAVAGLPAHLRELFMLRFVQEQPYKLIARSLDITPANARKRLQQARGLVREALRPIA